MQQLAASAPKGRNGRRISSKEFIIAIVRMLRPAHQLASDLSYLASGEPHDSHSYYEFISTDSARNQSAAERFHISVSNHLLLRSRSHGPRAHAARLGCRGQEVSRVLRRDRDHQRRPLDSEGYLLPEDSHSPA